jgi:phosphoglycolate phosphatase-like HAD superfamily hydrolase
MATNIPKILALDFDGVICDGLIEYFEVSWRAYCRIWSVADKTPPDGLAARFYHLRPVIETGWEMPILIKALLQGITDEKILQNWGIINQEILEVEQLQAKEVGKKLDHLRDEWIADDLDGWLILHKFYPGVVEKLKAIIASPVKTYIITTKEGRFAKKILQTGGIEILEEAIFGKEVKRPKYEIIRELIQQHQISADSFWFVEDRLKTLELVEQQPDLEQVKLFLADWGYNTQTERETASINPRIQLISLAQFALSSWAQ